jgi:hypothetical protein
MSATKMTCDTCGGWGDYPVAGPYPEHTITHEPCPECNPMTTPTIHLNGTSKDELVRQYTTALNALWFAIEAHNRAAPHARDYYPQGDSAYTAASTEHLNRKYSLYEVYSQLEQLRNAIIKRDTESNVVSMLEVLRRDAGLTR